MISLDLTGRLPIYEQICKGISELIAKGVLKENDKLPGARTLAKELSLNPNTVAKAYSRLELDGIVYSVAGKGCFVAKQKGSIERKRLAEFALQVRECFRAGISTKQLLEEVERISAENEQKVRNEGEKND